MSYRLCFILFYWEFFTWFKITNVKNWNLLLTHIILQLLCVSDINQKRFFILINRKNTMPKLKKIITADFTVIHNKKIRDYNLVATERGVLLPQRKLQIRQRICWQPYTTQFWPVSLWRTQTWRLLTLRCLSRKNFIQKVSRIDFTDIHHSDRRR